MIRARGLALVGAAFALLAAYPGGGSGAAPAMAASQSSPSAGIITVAAARTEATVPGRTAVSTAAFTARATNVATSRQAAQRAIDPQRSSAPLDAIATVTSVTPPSGPSSGGTDIVLVGTGFTDATDVFYGADDTTTGFTVVSDTEIDAQTPAEPAGTVDVTVTTGAGPGSANPPDDQFTFVDPPSVTGVTPASGPTSGGNSIVIGGTNLSGATDVIVDTDDIATTCPGSPCFTVNNATQITVDNLDAHAAGTVDVKVTTPGGTSATSAADHYTFVAAPTVTSLSPTSGPTLGGNTVGVTGTGFTGTTDVFVGATDITTQCPGSPCFTVNSPTSLTVNNFPAHAQGTVDVRVQTPGGESATSAGDQYTFVVLPTVTSVSPASGPTAGGNTVTVTGTQFTGTTDVFVGAVDVTNVCGSSPCYTVNSATSITVSLPAHAAGTVDVRVETSGGESATSLNDQYTFVAAPTVTNVTPPSGPAAGGNNVTLTGTAFTGATDVFVGAVDVTNLCPATTCYTVNSATSITVDNVPAHAAGPVFITVETPGGTSATSGSNQYVFVAAPTVTGVAPSSGPSSGGNQITLTGTGFTGATDVFVGAVDITNSCPGSPCYTVASAVSITVNNLPAHAAGTVDVTVVTAGGTSATSAADHYTFVAGPTVSNVAPDAGPVAGGNAVVLTGTGFTGATDVFVDATDVTSTCPGTPCFTVNSDTQITVQVPAHAAANGIDITVQTGGGTSGTSSNDQYSYVALPTVTNVSPATGPVGGGNAVTVTGTQFESVGNFSTSSVSIGSSVSTQCPGSAGAPCFTVSSPTTITVSNVPAHAAGAVDVTVTTPGGTSATSSNDSYTFAALPTVTAVTPPAGPAGAVTTSVTLTGSAFEVPGTFTASDVFFGALDISSAPCPGTPTGPCFTVVSPTQITVEDVPAHAAATVDVTVQTPLGTSAAAPPGDTFAWAPVPTVTNVSPNAGATIGGTSVVLTGTGFQSGSNYSTTAVTIGSTPCAITSCYVVNSATQITIASMPAGAAGTVEITVTTVGGVSALNPPHDAYTYVGSFPTVTSISPSSGAESGGAILTITGTNFGSQGSGFAATKVTFGSTNVTTSPCPTNPTSACFNVLQDTTIRVFTPPASTPGPVNVQVTNPSSTNPSNPGPGDVYTYVAPSAYTPLVLPFRICDTRSTGTHVGCTSGRTLGPAGTVAVQITTVVVGGESVPAGATAVVVNLTALNHSGTTTFVSAYPAGGLRPLASNVNVDPVTTQANLAIVALSSSGFIDLFNSVGSADVLVDVEGYFAAPTNNAGTFHALSPVRICDTRALPSKTTCTTGALAGGTWRKVVVSGLPPGGTGVGIPANSTAKAAVFNLTAVSPSAATFLAVTAPTSGDACPTAHAGSSNLNPKAGENEPNRVISNLGPTQDICVYNSVGTVNFIIDVSGWFGSGTEGTLGADFYAVPPTRICDTRPNSGTLLCTATPTAASVRLIPVAGIKVTPAIDGAVAPVAVVANLTGVSGTASTFLELYPADAAVRPGSSDLNPAAHDVIANLDIVSLATTGANDGKLDLFNSVGTINVIIDIAGWFQ